MISQLKRVLYFPIASYFRFFAGIRLKQWNPKIVVVTGSNGKTTLLHMLEAQIGKKAKYSHHANSSFGIPFDILGLKRKTLLKTEWIGLILRAPFAVFQKLPTERIYIVEADCDRPGEGKFLASLLKPEVVLLTSISRTHSMNFDILVKKGKFDAVEKAIAYEFGYFVAYCKDLAVITGNSPLEVEQRLRTNNKVVIISKNELTKYSLTEKGTSFVIENKQYTFPYLFPEEMFYIISMCREVTTFLAVPFDKTFVHFSQPPGRGSLFKGIKGTTLVDSCYNANLASMTAVLHMFQKLPGQKKWAVIGDMLEQGHEEKEEHELLADVLKSVELERIIFLGPRVKKYTYIKFADAKNIAVFENPKEVLDYLLEELQGGETILFKGARFMEGVIENLLVDKKDAAKLVRREKIWEIRRKQWGF